MTTPAWLGIHPRCTLDDLGFLPGFLNLDDPRSAVEQLDANYPHGGGWRPFTGFTFDPDKLQLTYPGDDPVPAIASTMLRDEVVMLFKFGWVAVIKPDGTYEIARMD